MIVGRVDLEWMENDTKLMREFGAMNLPVTFFALCIITAIQMLEQ
jgi:hypothetical protein